MDQDNQMEPMQRRTGKNEAPWHQINHKMGKKRSAMHKFAVGSTHPSGHGLAKSCVHKSFIWARDSNEVKPRKDNQTSDHRASPLETTCYSKSLFCINRQFAEIVHGSTLACRFTRIGAETRTHIRPSHRACFRI
jgi:hypothetical protein